MRDPNRPEPGAVLRDGERYTDSEDSGSAARDGFTTHKRRPRTRNGELTDPDRAERLERYGSGVPMPYPYDD